MVNKATIGMLAALGVLAGCAVQPQWQQWEKAGVTDSAVKRDSADCQSFANAEADRHYGRDYPAEGQGIVGPGANFQGTMARNDAVFFQKKVYNDCMTSHGYKKAADTVKP